jgi:hypothetical protein
MCFSSMDELMASLCFKSADKSDNIPEHDQLWNRLRFDSGEVIGIELDVITKETQHPNPCKSTSRESRPHWIVESFVRIESSLTSA